MAVVVTRAAASGQASAGRPGAGAAGQTAARKKVKSFCVFGQATAQYRLPAAQGSPTRGPIRPDPPPTDGIERRLVHFSCVYTHSFSNVCVHTQLTLTGRAPILYLLVLYSTPSGWILKLTSPLFAGFEALFLPGLARGIT